MAVTLSSGALAATFVPEAGMVGLSLRHRGAELLGQRAGLEVYVTQRKTLGIPLLHPFANRLADWRFSVAGEQVDLEGAPLRTDDAGLPMHGLLSGASGWAVEVQDKSRLNAWFDFGAREDLLAAFPFPHLIELDVALDDALLTITMTVTATSERAVPIGSGFHPYLRLPDVPRAEWHVELPVSERLALDEGGLPTGQHEWVAPVAGALGNRTFDDLFTAPTDGAPFVLEGGGRRIQLTFGEGYRFAQVFAPDNDDVIAFEPMVAPTNALVTGGSELPLVEPGAPFRAVFSIGVYDAAATPAT